MKLMWMYFLGWFIGIVVGAFFVIQPLIIIFFSIPFSAKLKKMGVLAIEAPVFTRDSISFVLQVGILLLIYWGITSWNDNVTVGFYVGIVIILLMGITKLFRTKENMADYIEHNAACIHPEFLKEYVESLLNNQPKSKWLDQHLRTLENQMNIRL